MFTKFKNQDNKERVLNMNKEVKEGLNNIQVLTLLFQAQQSLDSIELIMKIDGNDVSIVKNTKDLLNRIADLI
jgi:hypothetical protein